MSDLHLGIVGNCTYSALIDSYARVVWCCLPRFDGDPVFCHLLDGAARASPARGQFEVALEGHSRAEQRYVPNTAVLRTVLHDDAGNALEITDFAPRFVARGRVFRPTTLVRRIRPLAGAPRVRVHLSPRFDYGAMAPQVSRGSNHLRFVGPVMTMRLTTDAPVDYVLDGTSFLVEGTLNFILGPDETLAGGVEETAREFEERTMAYWREWSRRLAVPMQWQEAVIRAAITLKLCSYEETGAIIAAMTTSIPEAPGTRRTWDYRYCWLRDAFFVVRALNSLAEVETMENYLRWLRNIMRGVDGELQPVYGIGLESRLPEREIASLSGYRGMGPVRAGNQAFAHFQHDVYGNVVLGAAQAFFDTRLFRRLGREDFADFARMGEEAFRLHDQPDAGMWELRTRSAVHTTSSVMCWAACDRLSRIAAHLGLDRAAGRWRHRAEHIHAIVLQRAWNAEVGAFVDSFGGDMLDAGVLLMAEVGFIEPRDPRFLATLGALERGLLRGGHMLRYASADDFGVPTTAFNVCTFWYLDALVRVGREPEARDVFERMLACRTELGLLSEDVDSDTGEPWGNFPQTYSMVGIINGAMRLSRGWEEGV